MTTSIPLPCRCRSIACTHNVPDGEDFCAECQDLIRPGETMTEAAKRHTIINPEGIVVGFGKDVRPAVILDAQGYDRLAMVLLGAFKQAAHGKGKERHADAQPFEDQPMVSINKTLGTIDGYLFQAAKKAHEAKRLPKDRAIAELLGAINYLAGAVIHIEDTQ